MSKVNALVVLSGGQDSTTCLYWAIRNFGNVGAITFDYGQRHSIEIDSAINIARRAGIGNDHNIVNVRGLLCSTSPLTSGNELDKYENFASMSAEVGDKIEKTFVPMRNTLFLTIAMNYALAMGCRDIVTGICQEDNANYPDCTETFRAKLESAFNQSLGLQLPGETVAIHAPLMNLSKCQTVKLAHSMGDIGCWDALAWSHTSYDGQFPPTDMNHSNILRAHGFEEANLPDPLVLRAWALGMMTLPPTGNYDPYRQYTDTMKQNFCDHFGYRHPK